MTQYSPEDQALIDRVRAEYDATPGDEKLWMWFDLGRAAWLTLPRALLHEMPPEWQGKLAALLDEFDATFPRWSNGGQVYVQMRKGGRIVPLPEHLCNYRHPDKEAIWALTRKQEPNADE